MPEFVTYLLIMLAVSLAVGIAVTLLRALGYSIWGILELVPNFVWWIIIGFFVLAIAGLTVVIVFDLFKPLIALFSL
jgi:hypothetical protein